MKQQIVPLTKEEMGRLMEEVEKADEFDYLLFYLLKTTGRRIGELYGIEDRKQIGRKKVGTRTIYIDGKPLKIDKSIPIYKKTGKWLYGVKVKDVDLDKGTMKVWVLKRRVYIQDETILTPEAIRMIRIYTKKNRLRLEDHLFRKERRSLRQIQNMIKNYSKKAKINHIVVLHNFRHYFITELRRKGWTSEDIKILTGHKSVTSLTSYEHIVADDMKERVLKDVKDL